MSRNENRTCKARIEPFLKKAGWGWNRGVVIGLGLVNIAGESMDDKFQTIIADSAVNEFRASMSCVALGANALRESILRKVVTGKLKIC